MGATNYSLITMPFPPRFFHRDFLKINALGTIPFMKDGDATMTESCGSKDTTLRYISIPCPVKFLPC
jgi:hypothetical protein